MTDKRKYNRGAPTKYSEDVVTTILTFVRGGAYIETAATAAGINKDTLYDWLKRSRKGDEPYAGFHQQVEKALAEAELTDLGTIGKAAREGAWQAAAWRLERKFPDRYARKEKREITGPDGGPMQIRPAKHEYYDDEELAKLREEIKRAAQRKALESGDASDDED